MLGKMSTGQHALFFQIIMIGSKSQRKQEDLSFKVIFICHFDALSSKTFVNEQYFHRQYENHFYSYDYQLYRVIIY